MLWSQLGAFMQRNGIHCVMGCASVPIRDGGRQAADLWNVLRHTHLASLDDQVTPRLALPVDSLATGAKVEPPPLIKGYLRCGGKVLGPPAWDPDFCSARTSARPTCRCCCACRTCPRPTAVDS